MTSETRFKNRIRDQIGPRVFWGNFNNRFANGWPDTYLEAEGRPRGRILWVEFKWINKIPRIYEPELSALQRAWLTRAQLNHIPVAVITGCPASAGQADIGKVSHGPMCGRIATGKQFDRPVNRDVFQQNLQSTNAIADWLQVQLLE